MMHYKCLFIVIINCCSLSLSSLDLRQSLTWWPQTWKTRSTWGILWTWKTREIIGATSGKIIANETVSPDAVSGVQKCSKTCLWCGLCPCTPLLRHCLLILLIIAVTFVAMTYGKVSLWLWKTRDFFSYFAATLYDSFVQDFWLNN